MTPTPGLCACGCGNQTKIATKTSTRNGWTKGEPLFYLRGHAAWKDLGPRWIEGPVPVERPDLGPCWIWQRSFNNQGYAVGSFARYSKDSTALAGRTLFEMHVGPIPDGMELDHLCFTPACVRWEAAPGAPSGHLEVVTPVENLARRRTSNQRLMDAHCKQALVMRASGMRWRAIASALEISHQALLSRLKTYCRLHGLEYPASESTRPRL
jgi:HNH endonuclease